MNTARRTPLRTLVLSLALVVPLLGATSASGAIVINEVESQPTDFVEIYNTGAAAVDIGGYAVDDSEIGPGGGDPVVIAGPLNLAPGDFFSIAFDGLGNADTARLFDATPTEIDTFSYADHAPATFGRCPDGTGAFTWTIAPTPGAANSCPPAASIWPGGAAISLADGAGVLGTDVSGLAYQPSGSSAPGVLWASRNSPSMLYRLVRSGSTWTPDTANGWGAGKTLVYPLGAGAPDAEGVTLADDDPNAVYVAVERDGGGGSAPAVLRYDISAAGATLTATDQFDLAADLPPLGDNSGPEAITWIPDSFLVAQGLLDEVLAAPYSAATYAGGGLFFVGIEQTGEIRAYALDRATDTPTRVATIASGLPGVMALEFEAETGRLWAICDNGCDGRHNTLDVAQSGPDDGRFVVTNAFNRPSGMPNLNNEGVAIAPQAECVNGLKPVIYADDENTGNNVLREGTINCTPLPQQPPAADTTVDGSASAKKTQKQKGKKIAVKVDVTAGEALTAKATGKIKAGKGSYKLKPLTSSVAVGGATLKLKAAKSKDARAVAAVLADGKKARAKVTVELADGAGNKASHALTVKLKG